MIVDILKISRQALLALNAMKRSVIKCKTAKQRKKLPGTKCSASEPLALGYAHIKHYNDNGSRKGKKSMKVTQIP